MKTRTNRSRKTPIRLERDWYSADPQRAERRSMMATLRSEGLAQGASSKTIQKVLERHYGEEKRLPRGLDMVAHVGNRYAYLKRLGRKFVQWSVMGADGYIIESGVTRTAKEARRKLRAVLRGRSVETMKGRAIRQKWVNVYSVTRDYGGPEEGGWWYNHKILIESVQVPSHRAANVKAQMKRKYADVAEGNIYSVLGGTALSIDIDTSPGGNSVRPRYE